MKKKIVLLLFFVLTIGSLFVACGKGKYIEIKNLSASSEGYSFMVNNDTASFIGDDNTTVSMKKGENLKLLIQIDRGYTINDSFEVTMISAKYLELSEQKRAQLNDEYDALIQQGKTKEEIYQMDNFKEYKPLSYTKEEVKDDNGDYQYITLNFGKAEKNYVFEVYGVIKNMINLNIVAPTHMTGKFQYSVNDGNFQAVNSSNNFTIQKYSMLTIKIRPVGASYAVPEQLYYNKLSDFTEPNIPTSFQYAEIDIEKNENNEDYHYVTDDNQNNRYWAENRTDIYDRTVKDASGASTFYFGEVNSKLFISLGMINSNYYKENINANKYKIKKENSSLLHSFVPLIRYSDLFIHYQTTNDAENIYPGQDYYFKISAQNIALGEYGEITHSNMESGIVACDFEGNIIENAIEFVKREGYEYYFKIKADKITQNIMIVDKAYVIEKTNPDDKDLDIAYFVDNSNAKTNEISDIMAGFSTILNYNKLIATNNFSLSISNHYKYDLNTISVLIKNTEGNTVHLLNKSNSTKFQDSESWNTAVIEWENFDVEILDGYTFELQEIELLKHKIEIDLSDIQDFTLSYRIINKTQFQNNDLPAYSVASGNALTINDVTFNDILEIKLTPNSGVNAMITFKTGDNLYSISPKHDRAGIYFTDENNSHFYVERNFLYNLELITDRIDYN